jgi:hypothetical protein
MSKQVCLGIETKGADNKMLITLSCRIIWVTFLCIVSLSCANDLIPPNYDYLVGKKFTDSIPLAKHEFKKIRETASLEEYEFRRKEDGCILVFGVRIRDDIIDYWRVDSGSGTCYTKRRRPNM